MNFLSKKTINKLIAQALIGTSIFGLGVGYNFAIIPPIVVNATTIIKIINNISYSYDTTTLKATVIRTTLTGNISIPSTITVSGITYNVTSIGNNVFDESTGLTSVTIPNSVTSIGDYAFQGCTGLTSVTIPNSVKSIGFCAFMFCSSLTSVTIPNSVTSIGECAFYYCTSVTSVTIPSSVTSISYSAFEGCTSLTSVAIPSSVTFIDGDAFRSCTSLTSVTIPSSVTSINSRAFNGCTGITTLGLSNITYILNNLSLTATTTNISAPTSIIFGDNTYTVISPLTTATTKVATAESVKTQANVDLAQIAINLLPPMDNNRTVLQTRLDVVKTYIAYQAQLTTATTAVVTAEASKLQADVNSATTLVNALTNTTDKTNLTNRLTAVQTAIDKAKQDVLNLADATTKVTTSETTKTQVNVDLAQTAINLLPTGDSNRVALQTRLTAVQTYIINLADATTKVTNAESTKTQANVDIAQTSINLLPTGDANKTALQTRLDVVKAYIAYQAQLATATTAVVKAEGSKLQADVNSAITLVNTLTNATDKANLLARLTTVQNAINVTIATTAVVKAETSKLQADVTSTQTLVTALPTGTDKTALQIRLTAVQTYITNVADATTKVTNAETTKTQANVDLAQTSINLLPTGDTNRTALQTRLDVVKTYIAYQTQLATTTSAVTKAEGSKLQADVDSAKTLVNALTNVTDKTNLTNRLAVVQTAIDKAKQDALNLADATTKVTNAETTKTQANVDIAQTAINILLTGTDKTALQTRLDVVKTYIAYQTQLAIATTSVVTAEGSKLQVDVDSAKTLVNALTNVTDKTNLTNRLNTVQTAIDKAKQDALNLTDATTKVTNAEITKAQANVDLAQTAINILPTGDANRVALQTRLDVVKTYIAYQTQLAIATTSVVTAEGSKLQVDVDSAKILVNALINVTDKTNLTNRLNTVQTAIDKAKQDALNLADATTKVTNAEITKAQANVDLAQTAINILPTGDANRVALQTRLDVVKAYIAYQTQLATATNAVVTSEASKLQADVDSAKILVNALTNVTDKTNLTNRLTVVQTYITNLADTTTKVTNAETTKTQANVDLTQTAINLLPTGTDKTALQSRLDIVKAYITYQTQLATATNAVIKAEGSKLQADVDSAKTLVNTLTNVTDKTNLSAILTTVQTAIDKAKQYTLNLTDATTKVINAETTKTQTNVDLAQTAINLLPTGTDKTSLQSRLDVAKADLDYQAQLTNATNSVTKAEGSKIQADVDFAKTLVDDLDNVTDKTNLTNRLNIIQTVIDKAKQDALNLIDATTKVINAETTKTQSNVDSAKALVNALPDGSTKTDLLNRLNVVQTILNAQQNPDENDKQLTTATNLVKNAESSKDIIAILKAQNAINKLPVRTDKTELQNRLDALKEKQQQENNLNIKFKDVTEKVRWAEAYVTNNNVNKYIVSAQASIDKLPSCSEKTALQDRITKVKNQIKNNSNSALKMQAETLVKQAELMKKNPYFTNAWVVVNKMTACDAKALLMNRLKALGSDLEIK